MRRAGTKLAGSAGGGSTEIETPLWHLRDILQAGEHSVLCGVSRLHHFRDPSAEALQEGSDKRVVCLAGEVVMLEGDGVAIADLHVKA